MVIRDTFEMKSYTNYDSIFLLYLQILNYLSPSYDLIEGLHESLRIMSDIVATSMHEIAFDDCVSFSFEESRIFHFEGFFIFFCLVFHYDLI